MTDNPPTTTHNFGDTHAALIALCVLAAILMAPFLPILLHPQGQVLGNPQCDNPSATYYLYQFNGHSWRAGEIPLWNPYVMMGLPMLAVGQVSPFHPFQLLFILLPTGVAINWLIALSLTLSGLFFFGYLRALGLGWRAAFCGGLAWGFSSAPVMRFYAGHINSLMAFAALPLVLMLWERYRRTGRALYLPCIALAYSLLIFSDNAQYTYILSLFIFFYIVIQSAFCCRDKTQIKATIKSVVLLGVFILLGIGVTALQLAPMLDFMGDSFRRKASIETCGLFSFAPEYLLTMLCPRFFGVSSLPGAEQHWGRWFFWESCAYIGIIPLIAAMAGLLAAPVKQKITLAGCAGIFLILSLGQYTPLFPILYRYAPLFDVFRGASKYIAVTQFCLIALAAYGLEAWLDGFARGDVKPSEDPSSAPSAATMSAFFKGWDYRLTLTWAALIGAFLYGLFLWLTPDYISPGSQWQRFLIWYSSLGERMEPAIDLDQKTVLAATGQVAADQMIRGIVVIAAALALLLLARWRRARAILFPAIVLALLVDMGSFLAPLLQRYDERITGYPDSFVEIFKKKSYPARIFDPTSFPNKAGRYGLSSTTGYIGNTLRRYNDFINLTQGRPPDEMQNETVVPWVDVYKILAVDFIVQRESDVPAGAEKLVSDGGLCVTKPAGAYPRAFLAEAPQIFRDAKQAIQYVLSPGCDSLRKPAIELADEHETASMKAAQLKAASLEANETVEIVSFTRNRVELRAKTICPRVAVLNEIFTKDWTAQVNEKTAQVFPGNYLFRAVVVPAGESQVVFVYRPRAFVVGAWISGGAVMAVIGVMLALLARGRRRARDAQLKFGRNTI